MNRYKLIVMLAFASLSTACVSNGQGEVAEKKIRTSKTIAVDECRQSGSRMGRRC